MGNNTGLVWSGLVLVLVWEGHIISQTTSGNLFLDNFAIIASLFSSQHHLALKSASNLYAKSVWWLAPYLTVLVSALSL